MQPFKRKNNRSCITGFTRSLVAFWVVFFVVSGLVYAPQSPTTFITGEIPQAKAAPVTTYLLVADNASPWNVPADWNDSNNSIEVIGAGGGGSNLATGGGGGGGGAYAKSVNVDLDPAVDAEFTVGTGGGTETAGGDTWFCNNTTSCANYTDTNVVVSADGGAGAHTSTNAAGAGGTTGGVSNVPTEFAGGPGGAGNATGDDSTGGGGGAGNPNGTGGTGGAGDGSAGGEEGHGGGGASGDNGGTTDNGVAGGANGGDGGDSNGNVNSGGAGGVSANGTGGTDGGGGGGGDGTEASNFSGGNGGNGQEWDSTHGAGGGGGGGDEDGSPGLGGNGGLYGGGGGGGATPGTGANGIIVIIYEPLVITAGTTGTQTANLNIGDISQHVGGAFSFATTGNINVTGITVTESGTADGTLLDNIKLYYENDITSAYDCASESYGGAETQYGSTDIDGFSAANGTAAFTGSVAITTTSTMCVYVVFDITSGAASETIEISIVATSDFTVTSGTKSGTPAIAGTTTLVAAAVTTAGTTGSQTANLSKNTTNQYVGGAFSFVATSSVNVTAITITESGTIDALNHLDNIKLYYENDITSAYDCASESYGGAETQYGSTDIDGFSAANGTSAFSGSVAITTTSTMCVYVVFDITSAATGGQTIEISIAATGDYTVSAGTKSGTPAITGTTTVRNDTAIADGTDPGNSTVGPGTAVTDIDAFTLTTDNSTDNITALTVTLAPASSFDNISLVEVTDNSNLDECTDIANPSSVTLNFTGCSLAVTTSATIFKVRITPKIHGNMPPVPGARYATTATVTAYTGTNTSQSGTDTDSATITVDNESPAVVTVTSGSAGDTQVTLNYTPHDSPGDADVNSVVVLRRAGTAVADVPVEGTTYTGGETIGTATVATGCVDTAVTNNVADSCIATGLTNGTSYHFKIFTKDSRGNYDAGVVPTGSPFIPTVPNLTVGGNAYEDEATTALVVCDGAAAMIAVSVNAAAAVTGSCADANGSFSIDTGIAQPAAGTPIHIWVDGVTACNANNANSCGTTMIRYSGSGNITDAIVRKNRLVIRDDDGTAVSNANLNVRDHGDDNDIVYTVDVSNNIVVEDNIKVMVPSGDSWTPGGTVTTDPSASSAAVDGDISVAGTMTVAAYAVSVGGDFAATGTYSYSADQTMTFTATATGHTIDDGANNLDTVIFNGSGGGWSFSNAVTLAGSLTMTAGTLSGTNDITVTTDVVGTAGVINLTGGSFEQKSVFNSYSFGPTTSNTDWIFNNLTFTRTGGSPTYTKQSCATCDVTITGTLLVSKTGDGGGVSLNAGDATWTLSNANSAAPFDDDQAGGTLTASTSTFVYSGDNDGGDVTIEDAAFNNLTLGGAVVENYTQARPIIVSGNLVLNTNATLIGTYNISVNGGGVTGDGAINLTGGIFKVDGTGSFGGATAWTFYNLQFGDGTGSTTTTANGNGAINVSNVMTIKANQILNAGSKTWNLNGAVTGGVINWIQDVSAGTVSGTSQAAPAITVTAGNLIVVGTHSTNAETPTISDNQGNTYTLDRAQEGDRRAAVYSTIAGASGSLTVTITAGGAAQRLGIIVSEFSGADTGGSRVDQVNSATGSSTSASSGNIITVTANDLLVGHTGCAGTCAASLGVGYTNLEENVNGRIAFESKVVASTVTDDADFTVANAGWQTVVVSYKPAASTSPFVVETGGTFTASSSTVVYKGNGDTTVANVNYSNLTFSPLQTVSGKSYNIGTGAFAVGGAWNINPDAASALNLSVVLNGNTTVTGTVTIQRTNSATSSLSTNGSNHSLQAAAINVATGGTLTANNSNITLTGTGNAFTATGTFNIGNSTVIYNNTSSVNIENATYYHLSLTPASGTPVYTTDTGTIRVDGNTSFGGGTALTIRADTNNTSFDLRGTVTLANNATYTKGTGVMTLKQGATQTLTDSNTTKQDLGALQVSVNGTPTTLSLGSSIKATSVTTDTSQNLTLGSNTLELTGTGTPLSLGGTFTVTGSTVQYTGTTATVTATTFNNLTLGGTGTYTMPASNLTMRGNLSITSGATITPGAGTVIFAIGGGSSQTWTDNNGTAQNIGPVQVSANVGNTTLNAGSNLKATSVTIDGSQIFALAGGARTLTLTSNTTPLSITGTFTDTDDTVIFAPSSAGTVTIPVRTYNNLDFDGSGSIFRPGSGTLNVNGTLTIIAGTLDLDTNDPTTSVTGNISNSGTFSASSANALTFSGNLTNNGTFTANAGTVIATPSGMTTSINGSTATTNFASFTMNQPTKALKFKAGNTYGFSGTLTLNGSQSQFMDLSSDTASSQWLITFTGTASISYLRIKDSGCSGSQNVTVGESSANNGNNGTCWQLTARGAGTPAGGGGDGGTGGGTGQTGGGQGGTPSSLVDNFDSNIAGRWTNEMNTAVWDSTNLELDADYSVSGPWGVRYSQTAPGSIEHEAQATFIITASGALPGGGAVRMDNAGANDWYAATTDVATDDIVLRRVNTGTSTTLATYTAALNVTAGDWVTIRLAATGAEGSNVVLSVWYTNHGTTKPCDPGWIGADAVPNQTYTDSDVNRLDNSTSLHAGIGGAAGGTDTDSRHDFYKQRAVSLRDGSGSGGGCGQQGGGQGGGGGGGAP